MADPRTVHLSATRVIPTDPDRAMARVLPIPLSRLFSHGCGPIPPVRSTDETLEWAQVGQRRRVDLAGPGSMRETLVVVEPPRSFAYELDDLRGPMALLVGGVRGRWQFTPADGGTRITWEWDLRPRPLGQIAMPLFARWWRGYADQALRELESLLPAR